jgi:hypothetical protein
MQAYGGGVNVKFPAFLTSTLEGGEWLDRQTALATEMG